MTRPQPADGERPFRALVTCAWFEPGFRGGGPVRSVAQIIDTVSDGTEITLVTSDRDLGSTRPYTGIAGTWVVRGRARTFYLNVRRARDWVCLLRDLRRQPFDLLYVNSLFNVTFSVIPIVAARLRVIRAGSVVIAPRGQLTAGGLGLKRFRKRLFLYVWGTVLARSGIVWHASTEQEADDIRAVCPAADIVVNAVKTTLPADALPVGPPHLGPIRIVSISRISPKKNVDLALRSLLPLTRATKLDIFGPIEDAAYWARCLALIAQMPSHIDVQYRGAINPADVRTTFARYDLFLFPTRGENFGHVIAESLSASCPVLCSEHTPWTTVLDRGGGTVVRELTAENLSNALDLAAQMTAEERLAAKQRAGAAYHWWRSHCDEENIIDVLRLRSLVTEAVSP